MANYKHADLPGVVISGYSEEAAAQLALSGWVDYNTPDPQPEPEAKTKSKAKQSDAESA